MAGDAYLNMLTIDYPQSHLQRTYLVKPAEVVNEGDLIALNSNGFIVVASKTTGATIQAVGVAWLSSENGTKVSITGDGVFIRCGILRKSTLRNAKTTTVPGLAAGAPVYLGAVPTATVSNYTCTKPTTTGDLVQQVGTVDADGTSLLIDVVPTSGVTVIGGGGGSVSPATTVTPVGAADVVGTLLTYARADHVHAGVETLAHVGDAALTGVVTLKDGVNIGMSTIGNEILVTSGATKGVTANYAPGMLDGTIIVGANGLTITLPDATLEQAHFYLIKNGNFTGTTVGTTSAQLIDAATTFALTAAYAWIVVQSDGVQWWVTSRSPAPGVSTLPIYPWKTVQDSPGYGLTTSDCIVEFTDAITAVSHPCTLPDATTCQGQLFLIHAGGAAHNLPVSTNGHGSIDGIAGGVTITNGHKRWFYSDGTNYFTVSDF